MITGDMASDGAQKRWPGECDDAVPGPFVTIPPQPKEKKPGQLTHEQLKEYFDLVCLHCGIHLSNS